MPQKRFFESGYQRKLKDPRWQQRRLHLFQSANWECQEPACERSLKTEFCGEPPASLHVHHLYYERNKDPWDYPDEAFMVLCDSCHEYRAECERAAKRELAMRLCMVPSPLILEVVIEALEARHLKRRKFPQSQPQK